MPQHGGVGSYTLKRCFSAFNFSDFKFLMALATGNNAEKFNFFTTLLGAAMRLKKKPVTLEYQGEPVHIRRDEHGVPHISAESEAAAYFGLGWCHANDRMVQMMLVRLIARGEASEKLKGTDELVEIDTFMRKLNLRGDADAQAAALDDHARPLLAAYTNGINHFLEREKLPFEFKLVKYRPEPWMPADTLITVKIMGYVGLGQAQGDMERFLIQMVQKGVSRAKLEELFPGHLKGMDEELIRSVELQHPFVPQWIKWSGLLPRISASNNWAVAGLRSKSRKPIYCSDPHLEVNRLPAVWYEQVMRYGDYWSIGNSIPGVPGVLYGRTKTLAWGFTYGFMDQIDFFVEECKEGKFRRGKEWRPFEVRTERLRPKGREPITLTIYENEHGYLEGDPHKPGRYLVMDWVGRHGAGAAAVNSLMRIPKAESAEEAMELARKIDIPPLNFIFADAAGNIGYQMCGRMPKRKRGWSGLYPVPAWDESCAWQGFEDPEDLPRELNPERGYVSSANNDLNYLGRVKPINLPMGSYRFDRINELLASREKVDAQFMKTMHYDLYSKHAELFMPVIAPLLPDTEKGRLLREWDLRYTEDSKAAYLFERIYSELLREVFGKLGWGEEVFDYVDRETGIFADFYGNFDRILLQETSAWFEGRSRQEIYQTAIERALAGPLRTYGETRLITMTNIFFGGKLPRFLGFDYGPFPLMGCRATIPQGAIYRNGGMLTTFHPSYRMIADLATDTLETNLAGGPSDRRFSPWYKSDVENWRNGRYKTLRVAE